MKDDDSTTVSSHSNNSSNESNLSKVGGLTLTGQKQQQQQQHQQQPQSSSTATTSRRNKNRNKRRKEQQKQQQQQQQHPLTKEEVVVVEEEFPTSSRSTKPFSTGPSIRPLILILLFGIGALLGVKFPLLMGSTSSSSNATSSGDSLTGWNRNPNKRDASYVTTTATTSTTTEASKRNRTTKRIPSTTSSAGLGGSEDAATISTTTISNDNNPHLVQILSSRTTTVYGGHEGTITSYGDRKQQQQQLPPPQQPKVSSSSLCNLGYSYSSSLCTIGRGEILNDSPSSTTTTTPPPPPPPPSIRQHRPGPILCSDGYTRGYDDWRMLRAAIHNLNDNYQRNGWNSLPNYYHNDLEYWNPSHHHSYDILQQTTTTTTSSSTNILGDWGLLSSSSFDIVYTQPLEPFTICPGVTLRGRNHFRGRGGIYVNHPDVVIQCDGCTIDMGGTHFQFGSEARGVTLRGLLLMGASTGSLLFQEDGADVTLEDCTWSNNSGLLDDGAVADLNSTSTISFFRCEISDSKQRPLRFGSHTTLSGSSLIIRNV